MALSRRDLLSALPALGLAGHAGAASPALHSEPINALPRLRVHPNGHYLQTENGAPFFWMGDTAWQLLHALTFDECRLYLRTRARQGFTVTQIVALCEEGGIDQPNQLGLKPFHSLSPLLPDDAYFDHLVRVVQEAERCGIYVALLPTWGDKVTGPPWGAGPKLFRTEDLAAVRGYAAYLADRLRGSTNVVWMLGGDRPARLTGPLSGAAANAFHPGEDWTPIWAAFAETLRAHGDRDAPILYHPQGGEESTSVLLRDAAWLSVNGMQSGHGAGHDVPVWDWIARDWKQGKPTLDLEPNYEDHPVSPWPTWNPANGFFRDHDVRRQLYRSVFAGGAGVTYGHHAVWQFSSDRAPVINHADLDWPTAMLRAGAQQVGFLRDLMLSRPYFARVPRPELLTPPVSDDRARHAVATGDAVRSFAMVYLPQANMSVTLRRDALPTGPLQSWWYDPRTGVSRSAELEARDVDLTVTVPNSLLDAVLVIDSASAKRNAPGLDRVTR